MGSRRIQSALISVYDKAGIDPIVRELQRLDVKIFSTGGTLGHICGLGVEVEAVESLTAYPAILDGRVKTLHPKVFGGILARREDAHLAQLESYDIPTFDLVIVDLYPFENTVLQTTDEAQIIEKIDIGGIALIRAAAKNYRNVAVVSSKDDYSYILDILRAKDGQTELPERHYLAKRAFAISSHYDTMIWKYYAGEEAQDSFKYSIPTASTLRYGENPHQQGVFYGQMEMVFEKIHGKELSYNNLVDVDAALLLMREFQNGDPTFAILKHTNACGVATRDTVAEAWKDALAGDPVSAFGGILISNAEIDRNTALAIDQIFYEVLLAPSFAEDALEVLQKKKKRVLLRIREYPAPKKVFKSILNGVVVQDTDLLTEDQSHLKAVTKQKPASDQVGDLVFANKCVKHLKSNAIALVRNRQLIGMGCGQTSRVDALRQAVDKARRFELDTRGGVMASDAFFPFADCVEIAHEAGITSVIQPGGSIRDQDSIDFCDAHDMVMVCTGYRHFKH